jgi:hypothetical protein
VASLIARHEREDLCHHGVGGLQAAPQLLQGRGIERVVSMVSSSLCDMQLDVQRACTGKAAPQLLQDGRQRGW